MILKGVLSIECLGKGKSSEKQLKEVVIYEIMSRLKDELYDEGEFKRMARESIKWSWIKDKDGAGLKTRRNDACINCN